MVSPVSGIEIPQVTTLERDINLTSVKNGFVIYNTDTNSLEVTNDGGATWQESATMEDLDLIGLNKAYLNGNEINLTASDPLTINAGDPAGPVFDCYTASNGAATNVVDRIEGYTFVPTVDINVTGLTYVDVDFTLPGIREINIYRKSDQVLIMKAGVQKTDPLVDGFRVNSSVTYVVSSILSKDVPYVLAVSVPATEEYLNTPTTTDALIDVIETASGPDSSTTQFPVTFTPVLDIPRAGGFQFQELTLVPRFQYQTGGYIQYSGSTVINALQDTGNFIINGDGLGNLVNVDYGANHVTINGQLTLESFVNINSFITQTIGGCNFNALQNAVASTTFKINTNSTANAFVVDYDDDRILIQTEARFLPLTADRLAFIGSNKEITTTNLAGDVTTIGNTTTLATVNSNVGTFGDAVNVTQLTVNEKGLVTAVVDVPISFPAISLQAAYDGGNIVLISDPDPFVVKMNSPQFGAEENSFSGGSTTSTNASDRIEGFRFSPDVDIQVNALQYVDANMGAGTRETGIYTYVGTPGPGTLLASALVAKTDPLVSGFRTKSITPIVLTAGQQYVIATVVPAGENYFISTDQVPSPNITTFGTADGPNSSVLVYPTAYNTTPTQLLAGGFRFQAEEIVESNAFSIDESDQQVNCYKDLDLNNNSILNLNSLNGIEPSGGLFMQTANGAVLTASTTETDLLGTGIGSLTIPANYFGMNSFKLDIGGYIGSTNGDTLTLRIKSNGSVDLGVLVVTLGNATSKYFELEADFVVRSTGVATLASIATNFDFTYNQNASNAFVGQRGVFINNTTFDTTISNTITLTGQFSTANAANTIQTATAILNRTF